MLNQMYVEMVQREREREIRNRIRDHRQRSQPVVQRSVRRAVGRSIVEIGLRIAAEPQPRLARSR
jgi:hypothetical protein